MFKAYIRKLSKEKNRYRNKTFTLGVRVLERAQIEY